MKLSILCCLTDDEELNKATIEVFEKMAAYGLGKNNKVRIGEEFANAAGEGSMAFAEGSSTDIGDSDLSADDISQEKISMGEKKKHAETEKEKVEKKSETVVSDAQMAEYSVQFVLNTSQVTADKDWYNNVITRIGNPAFTVTIDDTAYTAPAEAYHQMAEKAEGDYCAFIEVGDVISENLAEILTNGITICPGHHVYMIAKTFANATKGAFRNFLKVTDSKKELKSFYVIDLKNKYDCYPFTFAGTILKTDILKKRNVNASLGLEMERDFFLRYLAEEMKVVYLPGVEYTAYEYEEHDITFYRGLYMQEWYFDSITEFWMPFLTEMKEKYGRIPVFIQYNFMYSIHARFEGNMDNRNKHVIEEGHGEEYLELIGRSLGLIEESIMLNRNKIAACITGDTMKWVYGILRNGQDYKFQRFFLAGKIYYGIGDTLFNSVMSLSTNILFINYRAGKLEIDGTVHPILYSMADEIYFKYNNVKYKIEYNGRYGLTKAFGAAICKRHSFHLSIPVAKKNETAISCEAKFGTQIETITLSFPSHFSRVCGAFANSHWFFGDNREYMMTSERRSMVIRKVSKSQKFVKELKLLKDMFKKNNWTRKYVIFRMLYFICRPFMTRKPIWMYIDKIYKGGDSSEYLYKYASAQNSKDIKHYYLVDKKSTDYKRLKKEGYKPLVRDSLKHRLVFLYADMMVISNSTVYAFNGYKLKNSAFIRDLPHFHVCCVQHGMSIQKIAIAQNRLRDNLRLYFCASKYEIENLSRPVYDYVGYDALKLTGVPRYDGLKDRAKKQIMISPTWRMQAAMPVRTSESEQRDYNPLFKESEYFKVFNALINDKRLIDAAEKYGYRIKYVLHPIVSSQVDDFDKNDFVDIVPAVGDMSYEDMFCESSLMVTDFSGIQFDFAYMRKPLVYLHHKDIPQHYEEGTFHYDTMAFGEICHDNDELIDTLIEYMQNDCKMKPEYVKRADDFFYYRDHNNCERIYKEMIDYQEKYVLPERY